MKRKNKIKIIRRLLIANRSIYNDPYKANKCVYRAFYNSDNINHPSHYQGKIECIEMMRNLYGDEAVYWFCICNAFKYRFRAGQKKGSPFDEDIKKARWYENYVKSKLNMEIK